MRPKGVREGVRRGIVTCTTMEVCAELTRRPSNTTRPMGVAACEKRGSGRREREGRESEGESGDHNRGNNE
jgi:hypothetical protein